MKRIIFLAVTLCYFSFLSAQTKPWQGKFEPIDRMIAPPNPYRTASGAPGKAYWQQRADYKIKASIDEKTIPFRVKRPLLTIIIPLMI